jgi:hypothetical protein
VPSRPSTHQPSTCRAARPSASSAPAEPHRSKLQRNEYRPRLGADARECPELGPIERHGPAELRFGCSHIGEAAGDDVVEPVGQEVVMQRAPEGNAFPLVSPHMPLDQAAIVE